MTVSLLLVGLMNWGTEKNAPIYIFIAEMYKKNQGHGICGAKNIYSSNVKLGNWVEDTIGLDMVRNGREVETHYETNTGLSYRDPKEQPPLPNMPINMPTTQELKAKNKEGMPYSLIFDHGLKEIPAEVSCTNSCPTILTIITWTAIIT